MSRLIDLTNKRFGRLKVIEKSNVKNGKEVCWKCRCKCGNIITVIGSNLKNGTTSSCGCYREEATIERNKNMGKDVRCKSRNKNEYNLSGDFGVCYLKNGVEVLFDLEDYNLISKYYWRISYHNNHKYNRIITTIDGKDIPMHKIIIGELYLDHVDRNPLDNRKENLRHASYSENSKNRNRQSNNTSGIIGVIYRTDNDKWESRININKKQTKLGCFYNFEDAVETRLKAEKQYYGEFAPQRHLFEEYNIK